MPDAAPKTSLPGPDTLRWAALILVTILITLMFFGMIRSFVIPLIMAAIVAELSRPLFRQVQRVVGGRRNPAAAITVLLIMVLVIIPVIFVATIAAEQALGLSRSIVSMVNTVTQNASDIELPPWFPYKSNLGDLGPGIAAKVGDILTTLARYTVTTLSQVTRGTAFFFFDTFTFLYALFFFLQMKTPVMHQILGYTGLAAQTQRKIAERAVSVSRATIKGTLVIGAVQGTMGGIGFYFAGIEGPTFWGMVMGIVSIIPGIGPSLVLGVAVIYLAVIGQTGAAIGLGLWAGLAVSASDNILRPILVGRDTQMHDILILISTLGGLGMFGAVGLVLGPVIAGLFVTIWATLSETMMLKEEPPEALPEAPD